jgi:hypothetical protein
MYQLSFYPRVATADAPGGITVSKQGELPAGDFGLTEWVWGEVSLWFVDADRFTADEREEAYRAFAMEVVLENQ